MMEATALAHPNVALIKYWGKRDSVENLPAVGSLSVVLGALATTTTVRFGAPQDADRLILNDAEQPPGQDGITACLDRLRRMAGVRYGACVTSANDFPTAAGLASSASGYAALVTAAAAALGLDLSAAQLSQVAASGSGSAPRSLFGGFVVLRNRGDTIVCDPVLEPGAWPLSVAIAVTSLERKTVSSRYGMELSRRTSPYYQQWIDTHEADLDAGLHSVRKRDFARLAELAEHSCLKMHAVMMATRPALLYWSPATLACVHAIRELRRSGSEVFFTIDAGPQVKAVCSAAAVDKVAAVLRQIPGVLQVIVSDLGAGAKLIDPDG